MLEGVEGADMFEGEVDKGRGAVEVPALFQGVHSSGASEASLQILWQHILFKLFGLLSQW